MQIVLHNESSISIDPHNLCSLPIDILLSIFQYFSPRELLATCTRINKQIYVVALSRHLWRGITGLQNEATLFKDNSSLQPDNTIVSSIYKGKKKESDNVNQEEEEGSLRLRHLFAKKSLCAKNWEGGQYPTLLLLSVVCGRIA